MEAGRADRDALRRGQTATLITVAPTGAEAAKDVAPALPVTLEELVATAKECQAAGASVIHVHVRDEWARPTLEVRRLTETVAALREATDLVVQLSTGGAVTDSFEDRLAVLEAAPDGLLTDVRDRQFRRRDLREPVAVHPAALPADAGTGRRTGVRAL